MRDGKFHNFREQRRAAVRLMFKGKQRRISVVTAAAKWPCCALCVAPLNQHGRRETEFKCERFGRDMNEQGGNGSSDRCYEFNPRLVGLNDTEKPTPTNFHHNFPGCCTLFPAGACRRRQALLSSSFLAVLILS